MSEDATTKIMDMLSAMRSDMVSQSNEFRNAIQNSELKTAQLTKQVTESYDSLRNDMSLMVESIKTEFKAEIDTLNNKIDATNVTFQQKVVEINDTVAILGKRMDNVERDYERIAHLNELKLIGIPIAENENLNECFMKLANVVGYDVSNAANVPSLTRAFTRDRLTNELTPSTTILVKFVAVHMKEIFYSLYLRMLPKRKLTAKDLAYSSDTRIIIGEKLSQLNHETFIAASTMKRENKIAQVFTVNGIVNVKLQRGGTTYEIRNKHNLEMILNSHATNTNTKGTTQASNGTQSQNTNRDETTHGTTPNISSNNNNMETI